MLGCCLYLGVNPKILKMLLIIRCSYRNTCLYLGGLTQKGQNTFHRGTPENCLPAFGRTSNLGGHLGGKGMQARFCLGVKMLAGHGSLKQGSDGPKK